MRTIFAIAMGALATLPAFAGVLTLPVELRGPAVAIGTPVVDPVASLSLSVLDTGVPVGIDWPTAPGGLPVPVPVFVNIQNGTAETWTTATLETGHYLGEAFELSAAVVTVPPFITGLAAPPTVTPTGPGTWSIGNLAWAPTGFGTVSLFATVPNPPPGAGRGSLGVRFTPTPEPGAVAVAGLFVGGLRRRAQRSKSQSGTP